MPDFDPTLADAEAAIAALVPDEHGFVEVAGRCLETYVAEYERRADKLELDAEEIRQYRIRIRELKADLARALPVVEAAGALVEEFGDYTQDDVTGRHIDLIRALAREVRGEQR